MESARITGGIPRRGASAAERGATLVEFAAVFSVFIFLILGIIDFSHYLGVELLLKKGAQEGVTLAAKINNGDIDIRGIGDNSDPDFVDYRTARAAVESAAKNLPGTIVADPLAGESGVTQFLRFERRLPDGSTEQTTAVLLRPGEWADVYLPDGTIPRRDHPTVSTLDAGTPFATALRNHPLYVEMRAEVFMFNPFLGNLVATGGASGYREQTSKGAFPQVPSTSTTTTVTTTTTTTATTTTTVTATSTTATTTTGTATSTTATSTTGTVTATATSTTVTATATSTTTTTITVTSTTATATSTTGTSTVTATATSTTVTSTTGTVTSTTATTTTATTTTGTSTVTSTVTTTTFCFDCGFCAEVFPGECCTISEQACCDCNE